MSGLFISFEGVDGVGKSSILKEVVGLLRQECNRKFLITAEPTNNQVGSYAQELVFENQQLSNDYHSYLFIADRLLHLQTSILPAIKQNKIVLCDRYHDSTIAYQGINEQKRNFFYKMYQSILPFPHQTIWLDSDITILKKRLHNRKNKNAFDKKPEQVFLQIQKNYQWLFENDKMGRICCIKNNQEKKKALLDTKEAIMQWINLKN